MLTWAMAYLFVKNKGDNGLYLIIAMGCDVAIFYWIAEAIIAAHH
jgi:hypothetical protein